MRSLAKTKIFQSIAITHNAQKTKITHTSPKLQNRAEHVTLTNHTVYSTGHTSHSENIEHIKSQQYNDCTVIYWKL